MSERHGRAGAKWRTATNSHPAARHLLDARGGLCDNFGVETVRAFIAIELGAELKRSLESVQIKLRDAPSARRVRWVSPENMHLTLKFLGNIDAARIPDFSAALNRVAAQYAPFELTAHALGCFPNTRRPNVVWVGLEGNLIALTKLANDIDVACTALGVAPEERAFSPHLTLGRVSREASPADRDAIGGAIERFPRNDFGSIHADKVHLIRSDLRPGGPIYTILETAPLAGQS